MSVILPLTEAASHLPPRGVLLGIDLGTKTIGVAGSDPDRKLATGIETIARKKFSSDAQRLLALATERSAVGFVLGLAISMDGSGGVCARLPPRPGQSASCWDCRSIWMEVKAPARNRRELSRAISARSQCFRLHC